MKNFADMITQKECNFAELRNLRNLATLMQIAFVSRLIKKYTNSEVNLILEWKLIKREGKISHAKQ